MTRIILLIVAVSIFPACSGSGDEHSGSDRPTTAEIVRALKDEDNPGHALTLTASDQQVECVAEALRRSDLSDAALQAVVEGDINFEGDKNDDRALDGAMKDVGKCVEAH